MLLPTAKKNDRKWGSLTTNLVETIIPINDTVANADKRNKNKAFGLIRKKLAYTLIY